MCNRVEQNSEHRDTIEEIKSAYSLPVFEIPEAHRSLTVDREGVSVFGFARRTSVSKMLALFNEIADLFDETFEKTAPEEVEA